MAIDPRNLRPGELCRLLNSTPLGTVINERQLYRHRNRAGYRLGDGNRVDLLRYVAWLVEEVHRPRVVNESDSYEMLKERARARNAAIAKAGRDIGELPAVVDSVRRQKAADSFQFFCEAYFPQTFHLAWSDDHRRVIAKIEEAVEIATKLKRPFGLVGYSQGCANELNFESRMISGECLALR